MADEQLPWDRQDGESDPAFAAFVEYRNLGLERSLAKAADKVGKNRSLMVRWSSRWKWRERVEAYDANEDKLERLRMRKRHAAAGRLLVDKALRRAELLKPEEIHEMTVAKYVETGSKLELRSIGEPTEITEQHVEANVSIYYPHNERDDEA